MAPSHAAGGFRGGGGAPEPPPSRQMNFCLAQQILSGSDRSKLREQLRRELESEIQTLWRKVGLEGVYIEDAEREELRRRRRRDVSPDGPGGTPRTVGRKLRPHSRAASIMASGGSFLGGFDPGAAGLPPGPPASVYHETLERAKAMRAAWQRRRGEEDASSSMRSRSRAMTAPSATHEALGLGSACHSRQPSDMESLAESVPFETFERDQAAFDMHADDAGTDMEDMHELILEAQHGVEGMRSNRSRSPTRAPRGTSRRRQANYDNASSAETAINAGKDPDLDGMATTMMEHLQATVSETRAKAAYLAECERFKILPSSQVQRLLSGQRTQAMDLTNFGLSARSGAAVVAAVPLCANLCKLRLAHNALDDAATQRLAAALTPGAKGAAACVGCLELLDLSHNALGARAAVALGEMLEENVSIKELLLAGNALNEGARAILRALVWPPKATPDARCNRSIEVLSLASVGLGDSCAALLGTVLSTNRALRRLDVSWARFSAATGVKAVLLGLGNSRIEEIDLGHCGGVGNSGADALIAALRCTRVKALHVDSVGLPECCAAAFADVLASCSVECLTLDPQCARMVSAALKGREVPTTRIAVRAGGITGPSAGVGDADDFGIEVMEKVERSVLLAGSALAAPQANRGPVEARRRGGLPGIATAEAAAEGVESGRPPSAGEPLHPLAELGGGGDSSPLSPRSPSGSHRAARQSQIVSGLGGPRGRRATLRRNTSDGGASAAGEPGWVDRLLNELQHTMQNLRKQPDNSDLYIHQRVVLAANARIAERSRALRRLAVEATEEVKRKPHDLFAATRARAAQESVARFNTAMTAIKAALSISEHGGGDSRGAAVPLMVDRADEKADALRRLVGNDRLKFLLRLKEEQPVEEEPDETFLDDDWEMLLERIADLDDELESGAAKEEADRRLREMVAGQDQWVREVYDYYAELGDAPEDTDNEEWLEAGGVRPMQLRQLWAFCHDCRIIDHRTPAAVVDRIVMVARRKHHEDAIGMYKALGLHSELPVPKSSSISSELGSLADAEGHKADGEGARDEGGKDGAGGGGDDGAAAADNATGGAAPAPQTRSEAETGEAAATEGTAAVATAPTANDPHNPWSTFGFWTFVEVVYRLAVRKLRPGAGRNDPDVYSGACIRKLFSTSISPKAMQYRADRVARNYAAVDCQRALLPHRARLLKIFKYTNERLPKEDAETRRRLADEREREKVAAAAPKAKPPGLLGMDSATMHAMMAGKLKTDKEERKAQPKRHWLAAAGAAEDQTEGTLRAAESAGVGMLGLGGHMASVETQEARLEAGAEVREAAREAARRHVEGDCPLSFNDLLRLFEKLDVYTPSFNTKRLTEICTSATGDETLMAQEHTNNRNTDIVFDEWLQVLAKAAQSLYKADATHVAIQTFLEKDFFPTVRLKYPGKL